MFFAPFAKNLTTPFYRRYWLAYSLSAIGYELTLFVLMVVLYDLLNTAVSMGTFTAISMFCLVLFGPLAGICVDRFDRKGIFLAVNLMLAGLIFAARFLEASFWLYALWFGASFLFTFLRPVRVALLTNLFSKEDFFRANALFMVSLNFSKIAGPLIGGAMILILARPWAVSAIAVFFVISCLLIAPVPFRSALREKPAPPRWSWREYTAGIRFLLSNPGLRFYVFVGMFWRLFLASQFPLYIVFVKRYLGGSTADYSMFMAILALGGVLGSLAAGSIETLVSRKTMIYGGLAGFCGLFALLPAVPNLACAFLIVGLANFSFYIAHVAIHTDIQRLTPDGMRGKVFASSPSLLIPIGLLSIYLVTPLADRVGVQWTLLFTNILILPCLGLVGPLNRLAGRILSKAFQTPAPVTGRTL